MGLQHCDSIVPVFRTFVYMNANPNNSENSGDSDPTMWLILIGGAVALLIGVAILPSFIRPGRRTSPQNACINNLRQIDGAKDQWALENNKTNGVMPDAKGVYQYIKGNKMPTCPEGGTYSLNAIGTNPTCTIPLHQLPH